MLYTENLNFSTHKQNDTYSFQLKFTYATYLLLVIHCKSSEKLYKSIFCFSIFWNGYKNFAFVSDSIHMTWQRNEQKRVDSFMYTKGMHIYIFYVKCTNSHITIICYHIEGIERVAHKDSIARNCVLYIQRGMSFRHHV